MRLSIKTSQILGLEYVSEIGFDGPEDASIPLGSAAVRGIRFALDAFGIRAVRILFAGQSLSPWLGDSRFSWYGQVYGDLAQLSMIRDVSIALHRSGGGKHPVNLGVL